MPEKKPTNRIDESDPAANMYGCLPCPQCGDRYRWPDKAPDGSGELVIRCDKCGLLEPAIRAPVR